MGLRAADVKNVFGLIRDCRCPRCKKIHRMLIDWQGRGVIPIKFCPHCKALADDMSSGMDDSNYNKYAATHHARGRP
jgi:phage FluMu protein Com